MYVRWTDAIWAALYVFVAGFWVWVIWQLVT